MRLNAFRIAVVYLLFGTLWFLLGRVFLLVFQHQISAESLKMIVLIGPYGFILINCLIIYKLVEKSIKTIKKTDEDYQNLYVGNPNPMWIYDPLTFNFLSVNNSAVNSYGYSKEEFLKKSIMDIRPKDDYDKVVQSSLRITNTQFSSGIWRHIKKDETLIYVNVTSHKIRFNHKDAIMVHANDTTVQVKYEQKLEQMNRVLEEEKQKLKETEKLAKVSGWEYFVAEGSLIWSDELYAIFGLDREAEKINYSIVLKSVHPEDLSAYNQGIENLLKRGEDLNIDYRFITKKGEIKYVKVIGKMQYQNNKMYKVQGTMQDLTELKLVQLEKNTYKQRLSNTLNNINDGYFMLNKNWVVTAVNQNFEKMLDIKVQDMINYHYQKAFPQLETVKYHHRFKKVLDEGLPVNFEEFFPTVKKWFCINAYPTDEGAAVFFTDITVNKEKDLQLKEALERYDLVAKATRDVIYDLDVVNDKMVYSNSITELLDISPELIGSSASWCKSRIHPDDIDRVAAEYKKAIQKKQENCGLEYRLKTSDNQYKYVYDQGYLQYDSENNFTRLIGAIKDIDQLKRIDVENKRLADIITKVNNMIVIQDATNGITWVNKAFESHTGYSLCDVKGKLPHVVLSGPETNVNITSDILIAKKKLQNFSYEIINYTRNKEKYWVNIEFTPLFTADGKPDGYIAIHTNITPRKEKEERIHRQNEILKNIAWMSSHELRRPVASILGLIEVINEVTDEEDKTESIRMMQTCTQNLDEILHKINHRIEQEISEE
jgi:PAS domain S-box-containing protein